MQAYIISCHHFFDVDVLYDVLFDASDGDSIRTFLNVHAHSKSPVSPSAAFNCIGIIELKSNLLKHLIALFSINSPSDTPATDNVLHCVKDISYFLSICQELRKRPDPTANVSTDYDQRTIVRRS